MAWLLLGYVPSHLLLPQHGCMIADSCWVLQTQGFLLYSTLFFTALISLAGAATVFLTGLSAADRILLWRAPALVASKP